MDKHDEDLIFKGTLATVQNGRNAETKNEFVQFIFECWVEANDGVNSDSRQVSRADFVKFGRHFLPSLSNEKVSDIFMNQIGQLKEMLRRITTTPSNS